MLQVNICGGGSTTPITLGYIYELSKDTILGPQQLLGVARLSRHSKIHIWTKYRYNFETPQLLGVTGLSPNFTRVDWPPLKLIGVVRPPPKLTISFQGQQKDGNDHKYFSKTLACINYPGRPTSKILSSGSSPFLYLYLRIFFFCDIYLQGSPVILPLVSCVLFTFA